MRETNICRPAWTLRPFGWFDVSITRTELVRLTRRDVAARRGQAQRAPQLPDRHLAEQSVSVPGGRERSGRRIGGRERLVDHQEGASLPADTKTLAHCRPVVEHVMEGLAHNNGVESLRFEGEGLAIATDPRRRQGPVARRALASERERRHDVQPKDSGGARKEELQLRHRAAHDQRATGGQVETRRLQQLGRVAVHESIALLMDVSRHGIHVEGHLSVDLVPLPPPVVVFNEQDGKSVDDREARGASNALEEARVLGRPTLEIAEAHGAARRAQRFRVEGV